MPSRCFPLFPAAMLTLLTAGAIASPLPPVSLDVPALSDAGGTLPKQIVSADFNGDGHADVAVANQGPVVFHGGIAVAFGDGIGNLSAPVLTTLPSGWGACGLAAADFDGDGMQDLAALACTTGGTGPIFILRGAGDGTFSVTQQLVNSSNGHLGSADFNGDGKPDLVFAGQITDVVDVYFGNGDGTVGAPASYAYPFRIYDLAVVNVDGISGPDIVAASGGPVVTMLNHGDGTFGAPIYDFSSQLDAYRLTLADFNGDQILDVATVDASGGNVSVGLGLGDGHFAPSQQVGGIARQAIWIAAGDFDGDGKIDLVANGESNTVALLPGVGDGTFGSPSRWVTGPEGLWAVDLDGIAPVDLLSFGSDPGTLYVTRTQAGGFRAPRLTGSEVGGQMRAGDLNADGTLDAVTEGGRVAPGVIESVVAANLRHELFDPPLVSPVRFETASSGIGDVQLADVNEDGILDVVGGFENLLFSPDNLFVMLGNGDGTFAAASFLNSGDTHADVLSVAVADVNADGHLDIVSNALSQLSARLGIGDGTFDAPILSGTTSAGHNSTMVADFTGDGLLDVAVVIQTGNEDFGGSIILLEEGHGDGTFALVQTLSIDSNAAGKAADLNADGRPDLAVGGTSGFDGGRDGLFIFLTTPAGRFASPVYYARGFGGVVIGDLNLDGAPDVVVGGARQILVNLNAGDGTFPEVVGLPAAGGAMLVADFTQDGRPDLVSYVAIFPPAFALYVATTACAAPPAPTAGNNGPICAGEALQLTASDVAGATYRWTGPNGFTSTEQNPTIPNARPAATGTYFVRAAVDNCASLAATTSVTVNPSPVATIASASAVCSGSTGNAASVPSAGAGAAYTWSVTNGTITGGVGTPSILYTAGASGTVSLNVAIQTQAGCGAAGSKTVPVSPFPAPAIDAARCATASTSGLTASVAGNAGDTCAWTIAGGTIDSGQGTDTVSFTSGGSGTLMTLQIVEANATGCAATATITVQVDFGDEPPSDPFHDFVCTIAREGITAGCGGGDYCPAQPLTRAQMAVLLLKGEHGALHVPPPATGTVFGDVPASAFAANWIEELAAEGITVGCGGGNYCPNLPVSRAQIAVFLLKSEHGPGFVPPAATGIFADVPADDPFAPWIEQLVAEGITGGCSNGNYCPGSSVTRGQMAVFVTKTYQLLLAALQ